MRAYELRGNGVETLTLADRPRPRPGPGQVVVRMRAASLNYSDEKLARGRALGADGTINYRTTPQWDAAARALTGGRGVDHVLEVGGGATLPISLRAVRDGGHVSLVGLLSGWVFPFDRARDAYEHLRSGAHLGKIVVAV